MKWLPYIIIAVLLCLLFRQCNATTVRTERYIDTVIVRDTIRDTLLIPQKIYVARVDTAYIFIPSKYPDSPKNTLKIPSKYPDCSEIIPILLEIERKEYKTDDYFAVIEGYKPNLIQMEVFPETHYITDTRITTFKKKPKFGVGIQTGYGYNGQKLSPYVGVGLQYNLFTF